MNEFVVVHSKNFWENLRIQVLSKSFDGSGFHFYSHFFFMLAIISLILFQKTELLNTDSFRFRSFRLSEFPIKSARNFSRQNNVRRKTVAELLNVIDFRFRPLEYFIRFKSLDIFSRQNNARRKIQPKYVAIIER